MNSGSETFATNLFPWFSLGFTWLTAVDGVLSLLVLVTALIINIKTLKKMFKDKSEQKNGN